MNAWSEVQENTSVNDEDNPRFKIEFNQEIETLTRTQAEMKMEVKNAQPNKKPKGKPYKYNGSSRRQNISKTILEQINKKHGTL